MAEAIVLKCECGGIVAVGALRLVRVLANDERASLCGDSFLAWCRRCDRKYEVEPVGRAA